MLQRYIHFFRAKEEAWVQVGIQLIAVPRRVRCVQTKEEAWATS